MSVGNYTNTATVNSTENTTGISNMTNNITVNKAPSSVEGENITVVYGNPIVVDVKSVNATNVTYVVLDKDNNIVANGTIGPNGSIELSTLPAGNYTINLTTVVDDNHIVAYNQSTITVNQAPSHVESDNITVNYGDDITVPVTSENVTEIIYQIIDDKGNVVANGTLNPGENITGLDLAAGNYTVNLTASGNENYTSSNSTSTLTVNPAGSSVEAENVTVDYGDDIVIPVKSENATGVIYEIVDDNGNVVANGTVGPVDNITVPALPVGNYTVVVRTVTGENFTSVTNSSTLTVNPAGSSVEVENVTVDYGDDIVIPVKSENATGIIYQIIDDDGNVVANGTVGPDGNITVPALPVGNYTVVVRTVTGENFTSVTNSSTLTVNPAGSSVEAQNVTVNVDDLIVIPVKSENATAIIYQIIDDDGNVVANGTADPNGNITVQGLPAGNYTLIVTTEVGDNYLPATANSTITVNKIDSAVNITAKDIYVGEDETITVNVGHDDASGSVNITVAGRTYTNVPVINGTATINVSNLKAGKYDVKVDYSGDDKYLPSEGITEFELKKIPISIRFNAKTITIGENGEITINVPKDATGTVTIEIDGKTYTTAVKNGKAVFVVPGLKEGVHSINIYYSGDDKYLASNSTGTIKVLPVKGNNETSQKDKIKHDETVLGKYETGNPIVVLLLVLFALAGTRLRRFRK